MKRFSTALLTVLGLLTLNGCYADVAPYSYAPGYAAPVYYGTPVYAAPVYRPVGGVYVAPPRAVYRPAVVRVARYGRHW